MGLSPSKQIYSVLDQLCCPNAQSKNGIVVTVYFTLINATHFLNIFISVVSQWHIDMVGYQLEKHMKITSQQWVQEMYER